MKPDSHMQSRRGLKIISGPKQRLKRLRQSDAKSKNYLICGRVVSGFIDGDPLMMTSQINRYAQQRCERGMGRTPLETFNFNMV